MKRNRRAVGNETDKRWDERVSVSTAVALILLPRRLPAAHNSRRAAAAAAGTAGVVAAPPAECRPPWKHYERSLTLPTVAPAPQTSKGRPSLSAAAIRQRAVSFVADRGRPEFRHSEVAKRHTGDAAHYSLRTRWTQRLACTTSVGRQSETVHQLALSDAQVPVSATAGEESRTSELDTATQRREATYYNECMAELLERKLSHLLDEQLLEPRRSRQRASRARTRKLGIGGGGVGGVVGPLDRTMQLLEDVRRQRVAHSLPLLVA